jgi:probable phosphomutase (TIGR03848 family)
MTTTLLIRHAQADFPPHTLAGRLPGVHLSAEGRRQADKLAEHLAQLPISAIYSSPLERAMETAQTVARRIGLEATAVDALTELDYGKWTGRNYDDLHDDPAWIAFNHTRSLARIPAGESALEVAVRAMGEIERLRRIHPDELVALVTHGDVIRTVIAHCLGVAIDLALRIEITRASVSMVRFDPSGPRILMLNGVDFDPDPALSSRRSA